MQFHVQNQVRGIQDADLEQWACRAIERGFDRLSDPSMRIRALVRTSGDRLECHMQLERSGSKRLIVCSEAATVTEVVLEAAHMLERRLRRRVGRRRESRGRRN